MTPEDEESPTRRIPVSTGQFSILAIFVTTSVLALLLALFRLDPETAALYFLIFFLSGLWGGWLACLAIGKSYWWVGAVGGAICTALILLSFWMSITTEQQLESIGVGLVAVTTILVLDLWALSRGRQQGAVESPTNRARLQRAAAARYSLVALGGLVLLSLVPFKHNEDLIAIFAYVLLFLTLAPWFVAWRRRQLAGYVYPEARIDNVARFLLRIAAPLAIASWLLLLLLLAIPSSVTGWEALSYKVLIVGSVLVFQSIGLLMFVISLTIQSYRDRWLRRGNMLTLAYALLFTSGFLLLSYYYAW